LPTQDYVLGRGWDARGVAYGGTRERGAAAGEAGVTSRGYARTATIPADQIGRHTWEKEVAPFRNSRIARAGPESPPGTPIAQELGADIADREDTTALSPDDVDNVRMFVWKKSIEAKNE